MGRFTRLPDPAYWRLADGNRCVDIGCYRHGGAYHFSTADIDDKGAECFGADELAAVLGELMIQLASGFFGSGNFVLTNDEACAFEKRQVEVICEMLSPLGFSMSENYFRGEILWSRKRGHGLSLRLWRTVFGG